MNRFQNIIIFLKINNNLFLIALLTIIILFSLPAFSQPLYPYHSKSNQSQDPILKYTEVPGNDIVSIETGIGTPILAVYFNARENQQQKNYVHWYFKRSRA